MDPLPASATASAPPARHDIRFRWKPIAMGFGWIALGLLAFVTIPSLFAPSSGPVPSGGQALGLGVSVILVLLGTLEIVISNSGPFLYALYGEQGFERLGADSCPIIVRCKSCQYVNMRGRAACAQCKTSLAG